jgi:hypothetical protein
MLKTEDLYRMALEAGCVTRTVRRWYKGEPVAKMTHKSLLRAAKKLKIDPPADPVEAVAANG